MVARDYRWTLILASLFGLMPLPSQAGVDQGAARYVPWSGSYWPIREGLMIRGPLRKYDFLTGHRASLWEQQKNPPGSRVPAWFGYCHAWASASVMDRQPVYRRNLANREGVPVQLGIGDQKGMLTACHTQDIAQHYGLRYTSAPGEDPQDIYPDELWRVLKLYVKQQGVPLIMDIESGPEVWNYPVYAYQVDYRPTAMGNQYVGEMSLWMADDAVPPDFIGVQVGKQTYYFTFRLQNGSAVLGTGRWTGPSVTNHPDFAWYPYIARAENPEVHYSTVKNVVDASGSGPSGGRPSPGYPFGVPVYPPAGSVPIPPNVLPGSAALVSPLPGTTANDPSGATGPQRGQPYVLSPVELLSLVTNKTSSFVLDVTVDKFDGGRYAAGEVFTVSGTSAKGGYLYLLYLDDQGRLAVLFPTAGTDNRILAQGRFRLPAAESTFRFRTFPTPGTHRIKAVATSSPILFSGLPPASEISRQTQHEPRMPPSQRSMLQDVLGRYQRHEPISDDHFGGAEPSRFLGEFGQDEVAFYVGPTASPAEAADP